MSAETVRTDRLGLAAVIVAVVAFLGGWLPVLGLILGAAGLILGVVAKRRSNRPGFGQTAVILSVLAILTNIVVDVIVVVSIVTQYNNLPA